MAEPELVTHGVGNPRREPFQAVVSQLQEVVGRDYDLIEVFRVDVGAGRLGFADTVPDIGAATEEESVVGEPDDRSGARTAPRHVEVRHDLDAGFFTHGWNWQSEEFADAILAPG